MKNNKEAIQKAIELGCEFTGIEVDQMNTKPNVGEKVLARQIAAFILDKFIKMSGSKIGFHIGGKDHGFVNYSRRTINGYLETDIKFKADIDPIIKDFNIWYNAIPTSKLDTSEEILRTIENNAVDNVATIPNVSGFIEMWRRIAKINEKLKQ